MANTSGAALILWVDFMKMGTVSTKDLNTVADMIKRTLGASPERSCCIAIGPQCTSERRSGLRSELRTLTTLQLLAPPRFYGKQWTFVPTILNFMKLLHDVWHQV